MKNPFFRNIEFVRARDKDFVESLGYVYQGYEGADYGIFYGGSVWIQASRPERPEVIYSIRLRRQDDSLKWTYDRVMNDVQSLSISNIANAK